MKPELTATVIPKGTTPEGTTPEGAEPKTIGETPRVAPDPVYTRKGAKQRPIRKPTTVDDGLPDMDKCGDDPLCGL